ncbi:hypothetical protein G5V59_03230 [Nocardioides sp. W3-2-3]|nr:hypothetical protein [Nocardioides convexus]
MTDLDITLGPALRERMRTEVPDLEHLAAASLRTGLRLRRRRRIATAAGGAAAVTVIGVAASQSGAGTTARDPEVAATSSAPATPATTVTADVPNVPRGEPTLPVTVGAAGWECESFPVDEKMWCTKDRLSVSVVVRPRSDYAAWKGSADKEGSAEWTSPVHGNYFVTIQGGADPLPPAELDRLVTSLAFDAHWTRP